MKTKNPPADWRRPAHSALKIAAWTAFAVIMSVVGFLVGTVTMLRPDKLTPMANEVANRSLNADVSIGRMELSLRKSFPFLTLQVDSLEVLSRDIRALAPAVRDTLPQWADTLITTTRLEGGINVFKAIAGKIDLKDLQIHDLKVNILIVNDSLNNFSIAPDRQDTDSMQQDTPLTVPDIRLNRFALIDPQPLMFADLSQDLYAVAHITSAELTDDDRYTALTQMYDITFESSVTTPLLEIIGQKTLPIGLDGIVEWDHTNPYQLELKDFNFAVSKLAGAINTRMDFKDNLTVQAFDFKFVPLPVSQLLSMMPDSLAHEYGIPKDIDTDARLTFEGKLLKPYVMGDTQLPYSDLKFGIPSCRLKWEKLDIDDFRLDTEIQLRGGTLNDAVLNICRLSAEGESASMSLTGTVTNIAEDPIFKGDIDGSVNIAHMPAPILSRLKAKLKGKVTAHTSVIAAPSMLSRENFHKLRISGDMQVDQFYYLADDTLTMYTADHVDLHFGTHERSAARQGTVTDSLLAARLTVNLSDMLVSGLDIKVRDLALGIGAQNRKASTDTTLVIPMGGGLKVAEFSLFSITDSAGVRIQDISGQVSMQRYKGDAHLPLFSLRLGLGRVSAGDNRTRFMVSDGRLNCSLAKLSDSELSQSRREVRHIADSLHRRHPDIPIDSVYVLAMQIRRRNSVPGHHRVHAEFRDADKIIDWGTSSAMKRLLLDWDIRGSLTADRARLFTPSFPVRNRVENFNITFNNDTLSLTDIKYKAGNSDFLLSGNVTNMKRAFTSKRQDNQLRIKMMTVSDLIDVNELAHAFFSGADDGAHVISTDSDDEKSLDDKFDQYAETRRDSVSAIIIPSNIDAEISVKANSVSYADLILNDFSGTLLMYDGALNLHQLQASSDVGSIDLTALYSAQNRNDIDFGFGMKLADFNISNFLKIVPAVDSIMPMLRDFSGIIDANIALTTKIDSNMDIDFPSVKAALHLSGDSLTFLDSLTFKKAAKWLMFKNKERNLIDHVSAEMIVEDGQMRVYPFIFDFDRYRLGVQGYNDFDMNFNYHIAVLKSPIPFKFGINLSGDYDKLKIRLGGAKFNENTAAERRPIVNETRVNLLDQLQNVFRRGVRNSRFASVDISEKPLAESIDLATDTISAADSLYLKQQGLIPE